MYLFKFYQYILLFISLFLFRLSVLYVLYCTILLQCYIRVNNLFTIKYKRINNIINIKIIILCSNFFKFLIVLCSLIKKIIYIIREKLFYSRCRYLYNIIKYKSISVIVFAHIRCQLCLEINAIFLSIMINVY